MTSKPVRLETLLSFLRTAIDQFPDQRTGNNTTYSMQDIGMAAFSVFYTQNPSFLAHQKAMREGTGKDNAQTIFGMQQIPSDNHIRDMLDPVAPTYLSRTFQNVFETLHKHDLLSPLLWHRDNLLIALDGTHYFSSKKINCPNCSSTVRKDGTITYSHSAITPVIVHPDHNMAISLTPEFIVPQDGTEKQDCETNAGKRWLTEHGDNFRKTKVTILGDALLSTAHVPTCPFERFQLCVCVQARFTQKPLPLGGAAGGAWRPQPVCWTKPLRGGKKSVQNGVYTSRDCPIPGTKKTKGGIP